MRAYREHQARAIRAAADHYSRYDRGQLILPCGTGKTAAAAGIREALGAECTLVLLPSLVLVSQFRDEWAAWRSAPYGTMCVCSDADSHDEDSPGIEALGLRTDASTDPYAIKRFLGRSGPKVVFSTYHSLEAVRLGARKAGRAFDLAVCDEAHRTAGHGMRLFGNIHHDANIVATKRLYMTATPRVAATSVASGDAVIYDMDDPAVFGRPFFRMTFRQAIDARLLSDYSVVAIGVADGQVRQWMRESAQCGDCGPIGTVAMNYALDRAMRMHGASRAISYHSRVKTAAEFAERHGRLFGDVFSAHVSGRQPANTRKASLERFASAPVSTVANVRCLVEGYDLPAVDMVFFCDPKSSTTDIVQAVGRALRIDPARPDKKGLVVLPVFHESERELDEGLADGDYRHAVDVLHALSEVDEILKGEIALRTSQGTRHVAVPVDAPDEGEPATEAEPARVVVTGFDGRLKEAFFEQVVGVAGNQGAWHAAYQAMLRFRDANPNRWPARGEDCPEGTDLWQWRRTQRHADRRGTLSDAHRRLLEDLGLLADARPCWLVQYQRLRSYVVAYPGSWPAKSTEYPAGNRLGAWCAAQRRDRRSGALSQDRARLLDGLGFPWGRPADGRAAVTANREEPRGGVTVSV